FFSILQSQLFQNIFLLNRLIQHGSLLLMMPGFQENLHLLPKSKTIDVRINLTLRSFVNQK
ncbi:MAG: hypothetical protein PUP93_16530, partial [Rhizonema sp. NSF051]|nr:hypothetical protein [Rhizonema sp. NSF051]